MSRAIQLEAFRSLQSQGFGVIDAGARGGVPPTWREVAPILEVVGFEPDAKEAQRLQEAAGRSPTYKSLTYLPCGLGETDCQQVLYLCRSPGASSCYKPNYAFLNRFPDASRFEVVATTIVPVRSLDSLRNDPTISMPAVMDFLKLDTQGSELSILRGAQQSLRRGVVAIEVEVEFAPLYDSQPVFRDVDAFLAQYGFTLFKLRRQEFVRRNYAQQAHASAGQLVFGDALYLRDPFAHTKPWIPQDAHQVEALILVAMLYDLHDFALELISAPQFVTLLDHERLRQGVSQRSRRLHSPIERLRVAKAVFCSGDGLRRYPPRWARGDSNFYSAI